MRYPVVDKKTIRRQMRRKRRGLSPIEHKQAGHDMGRIAFSNPVIRSARHIALYSTHDGEIDPSWLITRLRARGCVCYVPIITGPRGRQHLRFGYWEDGMPTRLNQFGIPEPDISVRVYRRPEQLDLILMPLVAFDAAGSRLGMGGGYYDRTLAPRNVRHAWLRPRLVGVAHHFQELPTLPVEAWDVPIDGILTNAEYRPLRHLRD